MYDFETMDKRLIIFANVFLLSNRLQTVLDCEMGEITSKQWLVLIMLGMFDEPPTLKELAKMCNSSHQNTKQIVLKLQSKGYVNIDKDSNDGRAMRISPTAKLDEFSKDYHDRSEKFVDKMFSCLSQEEISVMCSAQLKLYNKLEDMQNETQR
ncbi:MAG: MarR family transcriptional regulator [Oscillospiraceae bacterium]